MADNDFNMVKPVESLQNISGLSPAKRREERKRRQTPFGQKKEEAEQQPSEFLDEPELNGEPDQDMQTEKKQNNQNQPGIDYRA